MNAQDYSYSWAAFQSANRFRRAVRHFSPAPLAPQDVHAVLVEAALAPSSGNLQPYALHWIRDPVLKARVAQACNGQKAAATAAAAELVVVAASPLLGRRTVAAQLAHVAASTTLAPQAKAYHRRQLGKFARVLGVGSWAGWSPLLGLAALLRPCLSLLPVGDLGSRHWAARNAVYAAQTLILAAAAKGIDTCPMEGFSAPGIAGLLGLERGTVIPVVIALGYRANDARIEERWRLPLSEIIIVH